ncbi:phospholipase B1, membrane-associated-like [Sitophilus oryzae]|uniref:Phospholipase B1, membrane-associated n=1 Tax=Sitophilus oryzae TaxID=7048 RepID=A0A6J2XSX0_SITOR|nr:phospholipase B1, membrane-associated-like [Sitophilus oryzae]XP_030754606.1 phospholipase B1, membrane-associated-like [Sitophilus oryzae]XP_030754607.1 phospholipase B1, membrane-associated-like [Sitophilus oryzae]XP_030754608.1 phospholipase B1, membrane-associated-like [Sitophilus oryzae]
MVSLQKFVECLMYIVWIFGYAQCQVSRPKTFQQIIRETSMFNAGNFVIRYPGKSNARLQPRISISMPFPCKNFTEAGIGRSLSRPTTVHRLRPGDIDVIGAMGDSLVAGNGALEEFAMGTMIENRGVSWCAGGESTWRQYITLPNILKEFNPNLRGYSTGTGEFLSAKAKLNVAFPVAADADALRQAKFLVKKMIEDPNINIQEDWKMITIFFGANDICSAQCFDPIEASASSHALKLMRALDYLYSKLPRVFVNLIPVLDVSVSIRIKRTMTCRFFHTLFCTCFHRGRKPLDIITNLTQEYQKEEENLIFSGRYDQRDDFTVVIQPFMKLFNAPEDPSRRLDEVIDISYITHDCFHFSQKGHALAANMLWNNLLQPVSLKSQRKLNYILEKFECPKSNAPYLFTYKNSKSYFNTGFQ